MSGHQERIISHMNKDHQLSLVDYLVVYGKQPLSLFQPESVKITDVDDKVLQLGYRTKLGSSKEARLVWAEIPEELNVLVNALSDVKAKVVAMAKYAANKQGFSHKKVTDLLLPDNLTSFLMYGFFSAFVVTLYDRTLIRRQLEAVVKLPGMVQKILIFLENHIGKILLSVYALHIAEVLHVTVPRAKKHRAPLGTTLAWSFMHFIEGFPFIFRLNKATEEGH